MFGTFGKVTVVTYSNNASDTWSSMGIVTSGLKSRLASVIRQELRYWFREGYSVLGHLDPEALPLNTINISFEGLTRITPYVEFIGNLQKNRRFS